jgi:hypothetical protein
VGRPKRRCTEEAERKMMGMDVKDWRRLAWERDNM